MVNIVNNTGQDISLVRGYIVEFGRTGEAHEDIADLFELSVYVADCGEKRIIVEMADD